MVLARLAQPFHTGGMEVHVSASLGIAMYPRDGQDSDTLFKNADMAMHRAKDAGRNTYCFFNPEMNESVIDHLHLVSGIKAALANREFEIYYQPQFDLKSGRISGAEALLRWRHPTLGFIPPAKFIPVAERSGLINEIGAWVLDGACAQAKAWQDAGMKGLVMSINVSPVQFRRDDIEREVVNALVKWQLAPESIELELTESLLIADAKHLGGVLSRLRAMGVKFSIDDFGTGYSNLGYLKRFEVERLKIDQSFVRRMADNADDEGIVRAIVEMAHCLKLEVVAEGVENQLTLDRLIGFGCEFGQGYHWAQAMPAAEFESYFHVTRSCAS
jgi:EAL domain-containing protein (putative c-di-GMP-specific phosphodiesterase class I)